MVTVWGIRVGNQGVHSAMSTLSEMVLSTGYDLKYRCAEYNVRE